MRLRRENGIRTSQSIHTKGLSVLTSAIAISLYAESADYDNHSQEYLRLFRDRIVELLC